jgi:hypothetical protein
LSKKKTVKLADLAEGLVDVDAIQVNVVRLASGTDHLTTVARQQRLADVAIAVNSVATLDPDRL